MRAVEAMRAAEGAMTLEHDTGALAPTMVTVLQPVWHISDAINDRIARRYWTRSRGLVGLLPAAHRT